jgi:hypothetical protein
MILHPNLVVLDPIADGSFGANVNVHITDAFTIDEYAQRAVVVPFRIGENKDVYVGSVAEEFKVDLPFTEGNHLLYCEICVKDEVYLNLTFVKANRTERKALIDDDFGLTKDTTIVEGTFS